MAETVPGPDGTPFPRRNPNRWQEAQWEFRRRYATEPQNLPRTPVAFRWWVVGPTWFGGAGIFAIVFIVHWIIRKTREGADGTFIALYRPDDRPGTPPFLTFEYFGDPPGEGPSGEGAGVIVGEPVTNGTLLLETDGRVILPLWNPNTETQNPPPR